MPYTEEDAAYDKWYEENLAEIRREYGPEIADEITTDEIIRAIYSKHTELIDHVCAALAKAEARFAQGEHDEAVFHAARAFDDYITRVFAKPIQSALEARLSGFMPPGAELSDKIFKAIWGAGGAVALAGYGVAVLAADPAKSEPTIVQLRSFIGGTWKRRNSVVHQTGSLSAEETARFVQQTKDMLGALFGHVAAYEDRLQKQREQVEFSAARVAPLRFLARWRSAKGNEFADLMPTESSRHERRDEAVRALIDAGYIEQDASDKYFPRYRLTDAGAEYMASTIEPRLAKGEPWRSFH